MQKKTIIKILLVGEEQSLMRFLKPLLDDAGYETICAVEGRAGLSEFLAYRPNAVVVHLPLPDMDGVDFCGSIDETSHVPIIVRVVAKRRVEMIRMYEAGAAVYEDHSISGRELIARIEACLRRC